MRRGRAAAGRGVWFAVLASLFILVVTAGGTWLMWRRLDFIEMGWHGIAALALGIGVTVALWVGLMSLVYFSHRRGYDDDAGHF